MGIIQSSPKFQALDDNGNPLSGGLLYVYEAGTSTLKTVYQDSSETTVHQNPLELDSNGEATIYLGEGSHKFVLAEPDPAHQAIPENIRWTVDNIAGLQYASTLTSKTSDYILQSTDLNGTKTFSNKNATTAITFTLPAGQSDYSVSFIVAENLNVKIQLTGTDIIRFYNAVTVAGGEITTNSRGTAITLKWSGTSWVISSLSGSVVADATTTWEYQTSSPVVPTEVLEGTIVPWIGGYFTDNVNGGFTSVIANTATTVNSFANPYDWYVCDGSALNDSSSTIFNGTSRYLPNLTDDRFIMGSTTAGTTGGASAMAHTHAIDHDHASFNSWATTLTLAQMPAHTHSYYWSAATVGSSGEVYSTNQSDGTNTFSPTTSSAGSSTSHTHTVNPPALTGTSGAASSDENRPKFLECFYLIKVAQ